MKKLLSLLLALCLLAGLAACGGRDEPEDIEEWDEMAESEPGPAADDEEELDPEIEALGPAGAVEDLEAEWEDWEEEPDEQELAPSEMSSAEFDNPLVMTEMPEDHPLAWDNPALEAALREIAGVEEGELMLSDVWEIVELDLSGRGLTELTGIEALENLLYLDISDNAVTDLTPLAELPLLSVLDLSRNGAKDLTPLAGIPYMTEVYAAGNGIEDVTPLGLLEYVSWLDLSDNAITDLSPLSGMELLVELDLSGNPVEDLTPLMDLTYLTSLDLSGTPVTDLTPLESLDILAELFLEDSALSEDEIEAWQENVPLLEIITD